MIVPISSQPIKEKPRIDHEEYDGDGTGLERERQIPRASERWTECEVTRLSWDAVTESGTRRRGELP